MDEEAVRFVMLLLLFGAIVVSAIVFGEADRRYTEYNVTEVLGDRPMEEEVVVEGEIRGRMERSNRSGIRYRTFSIGQDRRLMVYCSLFNGELEAGPGDRVEVTGTLTTYRDVLQVSTQCYRVRAKD